MPGFMEAARWMGVGKCGFQQRNSGEETWKNYAGHVAILFVSGGGSEGFLFDFELT